MKQKESQEIQIWPIDFLKSAKAIQWRMESFLNKWGWNNWITICKKKNEPLPKALSIYEKKLKIDHNTIKLLE